MDQWYFGETSTLFSNDHIFFSCDTGHSHLSMSWSWNKLCSKDLVNGKCKKTGCVTLGKSCGWLLLSLWCFGLNQADKSFVTHTDGSVWLWAQSGRQINCQIHGWVVLTLGSTKQTKKLSHTWMGCSEFGLNQADKSFVTYTDGLFWHPFIDQTIWQWVVVPSPPVEK